METKLIGNKIAEARKKSNLSQAQLGEQLFISPQAVGKWERGESFPDIIMFNRLAKILGVDLNYFSENFESDVSLTQQPDTTSPTNEKSSENKKANKLSWNMSSGNWVNADFSGLKNLQEKFSSSNMKNCKFVGSEMAGLLLKSNNIDGCDFSDSDLSNSHIQNSHLANNFFRNCSLKETEFSGSFAMGCDFSGTDFSGAIFKSGGFENNKIINAVLHRTSFNNMHIGVMIFEGVLEDCYFENCAFTKVTFQNATLTNTFFKCRTLKKITFIDCKADRMTYEFLKNGKADLSGITLLTE